MSEQPPTSVRRALVTGAAGFIGCHLVERLVADGVEVVGIDNERSGDWSRLTADCRRIHRDLGDMQQEDLQALAEGCDAVYHLAAEKYNSSKSTPEKVIRTNITATQRLLDGASAAGVRKVVFTSSLYGYGSLGPDAMSESDLPAPITTYGMSKIAGEHMLRISQRNGGPAWAVARLFFVFGPRQFAAGGYKSVIVANFERILAGDRPVVFGDGLQALDYIFIDDVVAGLVRLGDPQLDAQTVNLGSGSPITVRELTTLMCDVAGVPDDPSYGPADWTAGTTRYSDPSHARSLGLDPTTSLRDGLARTFHWMEANHG